jgi:hypothetical protein
MRLLRRPELDGTDAGDDDRESAQEDRDGAAFHVRSTLAKDAVVDLSRP